MSERDEFSRKNLEIASDLIARRYRVRDEYLLGQPYYMDALTYIVDVLEIVLHSRAHVLEVSCGTGILAELLLQRLSNITLDVSDISKETLEVVKRRTERFEDRIRFIQKDNATYSFTGKYDAIVTTNAMRLTFIDYARLYRNLYNTLKRSGIVLISEAVVPKRKQRFLTKIGNYLNDVKTKPGSDKRWQRFASSRAFTERVDKEDILRVVNYYSLSFHVEKLREAGFGEVEVIYRKYHHAIIAGMKGTLSFTKVLS